MPRRAERAIPQMTGVVPGHLDRFCGDAEVRVRRRTWRLPKLSGNRERIDVSRGVIDASVLVALASVRQLWQQHQSL